MEIFTIIFISIIVFCCFIIWILPILLSWIFALKYQIKLTIGMITLPYLKLKDIRITNKGMSLDIEEIRISSSLVNSEVTKLLAVIFKDVRINRLVPLCPTVNSENSHNKTFDLNKLKVPHVLASVLQFTLLQLINISVIWADSKGWIIHATSAEMKMEGHSTPQSKETVLSFATSQTKARVRRRPSENVDYAEFNFSIISNTVIPNFYTEKFQISIKKPRCILNQNFIKHFTLYNKVKQNNNYTRQKDIRNYIPKNCLISVEDTEVIANFSDDKIITLSFQNFKLSARQIQEENLIYYLALKLDNMKIISTETKLFLLRNITLDAKLENDIINVYIILNTIQIILMSDKWPEFHFHNEKSLNTNKVDLLNKWNLECCLELWSISGKMHENSIMSFGHSKVVVQRFADLWTAELLLESIGWTLVGLPLFERRNHIMGTPLYLAVALIKVCQTKNNIKIDAMLDTLRVEWNLAMAQLFEHYLSKTDTNNLRNNDSGITMPSVFNITLDLSNCNLFFYLQDTVNIIIRLDSLSLDGNESKIKIQFSGFKMLDMVLNITEYSCCRSKDINSEFLSLLKSSIELYFHKNQLEKWKFNVSNNAELCWNHGLHMKIITIVRSFPKRNQNKLTGGKNRTIKWEAEFGKLNLFICLGKHTLQFDLIQPLIRGPKFELEFSCIKITIDNLLMAIGKTLQLTQSNSNVELLNERDEADDLELLENDAWIFSLDILEIRFPYIHEFSDAIQNELITTVKWLKLVHNKKKSPFTFDSPLPKDMLIRIDKCLFELSDDPFEVRLRDNYELLVDEYKESLKRQQMLDKKITELRTTHLLLPAGKVDELYANLRKKNAEIYIQRSKQIITSNPRRTRLLCWELHELSIVVLADYSYHGTERVLNLMTKVDPNSPIPTESFTFSTLWARTISVYLNQSVVCLRDFPQKFLECRKLHLWGFLIGAESSPTSRSIRHVTVQLPKPWDKVVVERAMTQLKFYHDLNLKMEHYSYAFGPCWEPVIAQCSLSLEHIFAPSRDPSPPLPFWDKFRLLLHGRITTVVQYMTILLHMSLDPYNTTEEMQITWNELALDWTDGKVKMNGDLDIYVRTASKYDDCKLLHLPNVKLTVKLDWICLADPNDHHSVIPCAPDKLPEYSSNQIHDSYRAFRSQNVDMNIYLETKGKGMDISSLLLYGSTLRWFESLKFILSGVTRPTRRGVLFATTKPRRKPLSRHYRRVGISLSLHRFQISYWMSFTMQNGCEIIGNRVVCSSEHNLTLIPFNDNLIRRPRAVWAITYMNCELTDTQVWLKSALATAYSDDSFDEDELTSPSVEKYYCLSVGKVSYGRETPYGNRKDTPTHRLVVHDLKGAWTKNNRDIAFALFDAYVKSQQLRKNLSADALKIGYQQRVDKHEESKMEEIEAMSSSEGNTGHQQSPVSMLEQLIAEADHKAVVFSDDQSPSGRQIRLQGLQACQQDDVLYNNWLIALVNSQVVLRGCSTKGYVILSAAKAEILQRIHDPESKKTWVGSLECLQYFATVGAEDEDIMWLPIEYIQEKYDPSPGPAAVVGSGRAAGGVVSEVVGASGRQIQRIVSRCRCEFFYVSYGSLEPTGPSSDAFTLMHHDLDVCTNSLQYAMLLDIINSLLLWTEPNRKEAAARLARLRFQLQLRSDRSVRIPVQKLQTQVRGLLGALRQLERDAYLAGQSSEQAYRLREQLTELKAELSVRAEELDMLLAIHRGSAPHTTIRAHEICFKHAQWRLTEADGQLGIADLVLSNFLYTKNSKADDSVEHLLELGYIHMTNLLPNQIYTEVLSPTEIQRDMPVDHKHVLRIFCREKPPVGGISVKEHFEINVVPITIGLTKKFYNTLLKFCFPERDDPEAMQSKVSKDTSFYVRIDQKDDVEKMKERAEKNKLFIYIKIPEVPVRVSYKGNKEKNIEDVRDFSLVIPTLEYHNVTWTWLDLLLAMKSDTRKVILSQAIKQKLQIKRNRGNSVDNNTPLEEDKVRMLLGKLSFQK